MATSRTPSVGLAAACVGLLVAQHVVARASRDSLFLSTFSAEELPKVMLSAAILALPAVLGSTRLMGRLGPAGFIPLLLVASGILYAVEWVLLDTLPGAAVVLLYLHTSITTGIAVSGFWSAVSERFDPHAVRKVAGVLAAGSAAGGLLGGVFARFFGVAYGPAALLPVLAGASLLVALAVRRFAGGSVTTSTQATSARPAASAGSALEGVSTSSYLRGLALLVALTGLTNALVDFSFKTSVSGEPWSNQELVSFFAVFYTATSVGSVLLQVFLARFTLSRLGLGVTLSALPATMAALGLLGVALPATWVLVLLRGSGMALETSLFRSGYEPLYAPVATDKRRSTKMLIDVACDRLGESLGAAFVLAAAWLLPALATGVGLALAVLVACGSIWLSLRLERGYVTELATSLRLGKLELDDDDVARASMRFTLSQTQLELDRNALLTQIEMLRRKQATTGEVPPRTPSPPAADEASAKLRARLAALTSGDPVRVLAALEEAPLEPELVSIAVSLLADDAIADAASLALSQVADRHAGQLTDALLDAERPLRLRRRLPRVLRRSDSPRVVRGLTEALFDSEFELRYRAGLALREIAQRDSTLRPPERLLLAAARKEVEVSELTWKAHSATVATVEHEAPDSVVLRDRTLDHVFTLLGLALETDAVELARRALSRVGDRRLRGTALEYLEQVVPGSIRMGIWPYLQGGRRPRQAPRRPPSEVLRELSQSFG